MVWREIIVKKLLAHIDGVPKVDSVIPEVEQTDPLLKGKGRGLPVGFQGERGII
jgi:hypothetical protein